MMHWLYEIVMVFIMSAAIGLLYRVPRQTLIFGSLCGVAAYFVFQLVMELRHQIVLANFLGSVTATWLSEVMARKLRKPATVFLIPGFIPLVPGRDAYVAMSLLVAGHYSEGVAAVMQTLLTGGAIAFGIFVPGTLYRLSLTYQLRRRSHVE